MKKLIKMLLVSAVVLFLASGNATASAILEISNGTDTETVYDLDGDGVVLFNGSIGSFSINITSALTKPAIGSADAPYLYLNTVNVSNGCGTLTMRWTDTDFYLSPGLSGFYSEIGGTTDGMVTSQVYLDSGNTEFGMATQLSDFGPFFGRCPVNGYFSDGSTYSGMFSEPFSLTIVACITQSANDVTSFDTEVSAVPIPTTLFLFASGLFGLVGIRRKMR